MRSGQMPFQGGYSVQMQNHNVLRMPSPEMIQHTRPSQPGAQYVHGTLPGQNMPVTGMQTYTGMTRQSTPIIGQQNFGQVPGQNYQVNDLGQIQSHYRMPMYSGLQANYVTDPKMENLQRLEHPRPYNEHYPHQYELGQQAFQGQRPQFNEYYPHQFQFGQQGFQGQRPPFTMANYQPSPVNASENQLIVAKSQRTDLPLSTHGNVENAVSSPSSHNLFPGASVFRDRNNVNLYQTVEQVSSESPEFSTIDTHVTRATANTRVSTEHSLPKPEAQRPVVPPRRINALKTIQSTNIQSSDTSTSSNQLTESSEKVTDNAVRIQQQQQQHYQQQHQFSQQPAAPAVGFNQQSGTRYPLPLFRNGEINNFQQQIAPGYPMPYPGKVGMPDHAAPLQIPHPRFTGNAGYSQGNLPYPDGSGTHMSGYHQVNVGSFPKALNVDPRGLGQMPNTNSWQSHGAHVSGHNQGIFTPAELPRYPVPNDPLYYQRNTSQVYPVEESQTEYSDPRYLYGQKFPVHQSPFPRDDFVPRHGIYPGQNQFQQDFDLPVQQSHHMKTTLVTNRAGVDRGKTYLEKSKEDDKVTERVRDEPVSSKEIKTRESGHHRQEKVVSDSEEDDEEARKNSEDEDDSYEGGYIKVEGVRQIKSRDNLENYFENRKKAGGGPIQEIVYDKFDKDIMYIQYKRKEDAEKVARKSHFVEDLKITVSPYSPPKKPPLCKTKVLIKGLKSTTTQECLFNFLAAKTRLEPVRMVRHEEDDSIALVTMENDIDIDELEKSCKDKRLEGARLHFSEVRYSTVILVSSIPAGCSHDTLLYYFENYNKSGGGTVDKIVFSADKTSSMVYFTDYKSAENVTHRDHQINKQKLNVKEYQECLGEPKNWRKERADLPYTVTFTTADKNVSEFIRQDKDSERRKEMEEKLENVSAKIDWTKEEVTLISTFEDTSDEKLIDSQAWQVRAQRAYEEGIKNISHYQCEVPEICFTEVTKYLKEISIEKPESVRIKIFNEKRIISFTGIKDVAESLFNKVSDVIRNQKTVKKEVISLTKIDCSLLLKSYFQSTLTKLYPTLKVNVDVDKEEVTFEGTSDDIKNAKLKVAEQNSSYAKEHVNFSETCMKLINNENVSDYVNQTLSRKQIVCEWDTSEGCVTVYCLNENAVRECVEILQRSVCEEKIPLCEEAVPYLETEEWKTHTEHVCSKHKYKVIIEVFDDKDFVVICAANDILKNCVDEVKGLIKANIQLQSKYPCATTVCLYIEKYLQPNVNDITKRLETQRVKIYQCSKYDGFLIRGTEEGIEQAKLQMRDLVDSIQRQEHTIKEPYFIQCIKSKPGKSHLQTIEKDLTCLILEKDKHEEVSSRSGNLETKLKYKVTERTTIVIVQGDITKLSTKVIVNSADEKLSLGYGLGKILRKEGGKQVVEECSAYIAKHDRLEEDAVCVTGAGDLQIKNIFHVFVSGFHKGRHSERKLERAVLNCLEYANGKEMESIALPAVGCGAAKYPEELATNTIVSAVAKFLRQEDDPKLAKIYLCDMKQSVVDRFTSAVNEFFGNESDNDDKRRGNRSRPKSGHYRKHSSRSPETSNRRKPVNIGNISVDIIKGSVAKSKADVIVNVTDTSLNLSHGTISASLLKEGGDKLQEELKAKCPNGLQHGQIAVTSGHKLMCSSVIHACLVQWKANNDQESTEGVKNFTLNCLKGASSQNYTSIVFPAIGTGKLGYPKEVVAKEMFAAIETFANINPKSSVKEVRVVIYQGDTSTIRGDNGHGIIAEAAYPRVKHQAFEEESSHWTTGKRLGQRGVRRFADDSDEDGDSQTFKIGTLSVNIKEGDMLEEYTDCIVISIPLSMDLQKGATSRSLLKKCGQEIVDELEEKKKTLRNYNLVTSSAPNLACKRVIYIAVQSDLDGWVTVMMKALKEAEKRQMTSIAFPALGTGRGGKPKEMAKLMLQSIVDFEKTSPEHVKEVRIVIFQHEMLGVFEKVAAGVGTDRTGSSSDDETTFGGPRRHHKRRGSTKHGGVTFIIVARDDNTIERGISRIEKCFGKKEIADDIIRKFNRYHEKQLRELESKKHVKVSLEKGKGKIRILGFAENVQEASEQVHIIMRGALEYEKNTSNADLMSNIVQWYFEDTSGQETKLVAYDKKVNFKIEKAYESKELTVKFRDDKKEVYIVDLKQMIEFPVDKPNDQVKVVRKDIKAESLGIPTHWKDLQGNLNVVPLAATDKEYIDTEKDFIASIGAGITVVKIERIQNRTLWQQYQALKRLMEQKNPPNTKNESFLWHGSGSLGIENIKVHGFDRSYSNSANYGVGVYFSPNARVSRGFARPDPTTGICRMFRCRVLTGEYCLAQSGIRTGPPKPAGGPNAKYDSVVNNMTSPTEIVIFNDTQAYPDYLISFK